MGTKFYSAISAETIDSSGEKLHLEGLDISDFLEGRAYANWEHQSKSPDDFCGIFTYAKKIFSEKDCENERQREIWNQIELPYLYGECELFDDTDHAGAHAIAAMMRYFQSRKEKIQIGISIEGATLLREGSDLKRTVGRRASITLRPCNRVCWVNMIEDTKTDIAKSEDFGIGHSVHTVELDSAIFDDQMPPSADPIADLKKALHDLNKTLTAGGGNVAPSQLTGGAALVREDISGSQKNRMKAAVRDWNRTRPLKETIKAAMPEVSDSYIDYFTELAEEMALKKGEPASLTRIGNQHSTHKYDSEEQKRLIEGIYFSDDSKKGKFHYGVNDAGEKVSMKPYLGANEQYPAMFHNIATNVFGLQDHVPAVGVIRHEKAGNSQPLLVHKRKEGYTHPFLNPKEFATEMNHSREDGSGHKVALMDIILGNGNDHIGNTAISKEGKLLSSNNEKPFSYDQPQSMEYARSNAFSEFGYDGMMNDNLHIDTHKWLMSLDKKKLATELAKYGVDGGIIKTAVARLRVTQLMAKKGATLGQMIEATDPKVNRD